MTVQNVKVAIVGSGFGMLVILDRLYERGLRDSEISIYSKDHMGIGDAYKGTPIVFLMNTKTSALSMFDHIENFNNWLEDNCGLAAPFPDFLPRSTFGKYLVDIRESLLKRSRSKGNRITLKGSVDCIAPDGTVIQSDGRTSSSDIIFLSPGFGSNFSVEQATHEIMGTPQNGALQVIGSGLTAIDAVLLTSTLRPDLKIDCVSLNGRFPRIRSDFDVAESRVLDDFLTSSEFTAKDVINRIAESSVNEDDRAFFDGKLSHSDELAIAEESVSGWQSAAYNSTRHYATVFQRLSAKDRDFLLRHRGTFLERRGMYPIENGRKIVALLNSGQLNVRRARIPNAEVGRRGIISAYSPSNPLRLLLYRSGFVMEAHNSVKCDYSGCICSKRQIYALGPMTNSTRYFTEASSLTKRDGTAAVDAAINYQSARTTCNKAQRRRAHVR